MPGLMDMHVHISHEQQGAASYAESFFLNPADMALRATTYAKKTLMAGFTTVQSLGSPSDVPLRDAITRGAAPGPRVLTSAGQIDPGARTPEELRAVVGAFRANGADVIKAFAPEGMSTPAAARV